MGQKIDAVCQSNHGEKWALVGAALGKGLEWLEANMAGQGRLGSQKRGSGPVAEQQLEGLTTGKA